MVIDKQFPENYFRCANHKTLVNIFFTTHWLMEKVKLFLEKDDLTPQQYNILRILNQSKIPLSTLKIREMMLDKMSDTSRIVERLIKKELVDKQTSHLDKRLVEITLTQKGAQLINKLESNSGELDSIINNLTQQDITHLNNLLDKIREQEQ